MNGSGRALSSAASRDAPVPFREQFAERRERTDEALRTFLSRKRAELEDTSGPAPELGEELERLVFAGGKRLRPVLTQQAYLACGGEPLAPVLPLSLAMELLHTYLLIHDDIMDQAEVRRGRPAAHVRLRDRCSGRAGEREARHFGRSAAILAGDLAHSWAVELFLRARPEAADGPGLDRCFRATCEEVVAGQYEEMLVAFESDPSEEELLRVLRLKSGRYSVERPLEMGARFAGADEETLDALGRYGAAVGEAFQLQDDVLGTFGEPETVGKPVGSDLAEGKHTFLVHCTLERAEESAAGRLRQLLGRPDPGPEEVQEARRIIRASGGLDAVRGMMDRRLDRATAALEELALSPDHHRFFEGLVHYMGDRER